LWIFLIHGAGGNGALAGGKTEAALFRLAANEMGSNI